MTGVLDLTPQRRARKFRLAVRLVFYPLAVGLIAIAWHHYHGDSARAVPIVRWQGLTSQKEPIAATTQAGVLTFLDTRVIEACSDGSAIRFHWYPVQHRFVQNGEAVHGRQVGASSE